MKVLIIYAHPDQNSFNHAVLEKVKTGLEVGKHTYTVIDLYKRNFDPVLVYNDEKKKGDLTSDPQVTQFQELIKQADHLIFIYPIWWYGMPAILKGFIDKVFLSGFAYTNKGGFPKGLLSDKSAWVLYTIDSPPWFVRLFRRSIEWKVMNNAVLKYCGIKHAKRLMFAGVKGSNEHGRLKWLNYIAEQAQSNLN